MKNFSSRYRPRFIRSLVYMLQASEYHSREYIAWVARTKDFAHVEKRKQLDWTKKAILLYASSWVIIGILLALIIICWLTLGELGSVLGVLLLLTAPFMLPYLLLIPLAIIEFFQRPVERRIIARAAKKLAQHPAFKIAIAGSYGKTSMREIVRSILSEGRRVAAPGGSENTPLAIARFIDGLQGDEEVLIFELGEYYPGDIAQLCNMVKPNIGIITGVNEAHLEKFESLNATADTIFELAAELEGGMLYVNGENALARVKAPNSSLFYSREGVDTSVVKDAHADLGGTSFTIENNRIHIPAKTSLLGLHQIGPIVAAAHIAARIGLSVAQIEAGIAQVRPFAHRLERRDWPGGVVFLDDSYNGNPDGASAVIDFLASLSGRRFYVTPGLVEMGARSKQIHREIGAKLAAAKIENVVLIRDSVTPWIEQGLKDADYQGTISWYENMPHALTALQHATVGGDIVLVQNDWPDQYA